MPRTETLANIRLRAQQEANMVNSSLVGTGEWNAWANSEYPELYELLVRAGENFSETTVNLTVGTDIVSGVANLPSDFLGVLLVSRQLNGQQFVPLREVMLREIDRFPVSSTIATHYRLVNNTMEFYPHPSASGQIYRLKYLPVAATLSADSDTVNGVNGWEEFIVLGMAIRALQKIESDSTPLERRKEVMRARIQQMIDLRNLSEARRVVDTADEGFPIDPASFYPYRGSW